MKIAHFVLAVALLFAAVIHLPATEQGTLDSHLEPLRPWLGKIWKSEATERSEKPRVDVARWERALNGKAVRILHSVNDGEYGGETIVTWDEKRKLVVYQYFTTAGFNTSGTMSFEQNRVVTNESVSGQAGGVTEVRGTIEMAGDGMFRMKTEYLKEGQWQPGRDATYREAAGSAVVFK